MQKDSSSWAKNLGLFAVIISDLVGFTGLGVGVGYWAHSHWGAPIWVTLVSSVLGLCLAMYRVYLDAQKLNEDERK
jgi:F0F1-type ATP synthase assembly protein I